MPVPYSGEPEKTGVVQPSRVSVRVPLLIVYIVDMNFCCSDQLWTNGGAYKPPTEGHEFPLDLDGYPEYGEGWQNEQGVRIDMHHRLIPKQPLRSALKQTRR